MKFSAIDISSEINFVSTCLIGIIKNYSRITILILILLPNLCYVDSINYFYNQEVLFPIFSLAVALIILLIYNIIFIKSLLIDFKIGLVFLLFLILFVNVFYFDSIKLNQNKIDLVLLYILTYFLFKSSLKIYNTMGYHILMQLYIFIQIVIGTSKINNNNQLIGAFGNPNVLSEHIALLTLFSLRCMFLRDMISNFSNLLKLISTITFVLSLYIIIRNESRLAFIIIIILFLYSSNIVSTLFTNKFFTSIAIFIFALLLYFFKPHSIDGRIFVWKISLLGIKENVLWGTGFGSFPNTYILNQISYFKKHSNPNEELLSDSVLYAFNEFLQMICEFGIIPIIFISIYFFIFKYKEFEIELRNKLNYLLPSTLLLISCIFSYPLHKYSFMSIMLILFLEIPSNKYALNKKFNFNFYYKSFISGIVVILFIICYYSITYFKYELKWYTKYTNLSIPINCNEINNDLLHIKNNYVLLYALGGRLNSEKQFYCSNIYLKELLNITKDENILMLIGDNYVGLNDLKNAELYYLEANYSVPNRLLPKYKLLIIYEFQNDSNQAKYWANKILNTKIKIRAPVTDRIQSYAFNYINKIK